MRHAHTDRGGSPIGVEPQPREVKEIATVEVTDYAYHNVITVTGKARSC